MKRYACCLALLGVAAVPDWASAFGRRCWSGPVYYEPVYYPPPAYCVPVYVAPACVPHSTPAPKTARLTDPPKPMPNGSEGVRPAGGIAPTANSPTITPEKSEPAEKQPTPPKLEIPKFEPPAKLDIPKSEPMEKSPAPKLELPNFGPKSPAATDTQPGGIAAPSPAPSSLTLPPAVGPDPVAPLIPPAGIPPLPEPKKADTLPPLVLPPESPVRSGTTAKSSPLTGAGGVTVQTYAASGRMAADGRMAVGFYNHTDRELALTIEGKDVTLPARSYVTAKLGASFRWKHGDNPTETATVPADAVGLDVVFRE